MKELAPTLFVNPEPSIDYIGNHPPIPGLLYCEGYTYQDICVPNLVTFKKRMKKEKNIHGDTFTDIVNSCKGYVMKHYKKNKYTQVTLPVPEGEAEIVDGDASNVNAFKKLMLMRSARAMLPCSENNIIDNQISILDHMNSNEFYSLIHMDQLVFTNDTTKMSHALKSVTLTKTLDKTPEEKALSLVCISLIHRINSDIRGHSNSYISVNIECADGGFASSLRPDDTTPSPNRQNQMKHNYFTQIQKLPSINKYAETIEKLITMLFYFKLNIFPENEVIDVPQLNFLAIEIGSLKTAIDALKVNLESQDLLSAAVESLHVLLYKILTTNFKKTDPYTKSIFHFFSFAMHLRTSNGDSVVCGKIGSLKKIAAHLLFVLKGIVFSKQIQIDSGVGNNSENPLLWLLCASAPTLTQFNFVVNMFKVADAFSADEQSTANDILILFDDDNTTREGISIKGNKLMHSTFIQGNKKLLEDLDTLLKEVLCGFPIGPRDAFFKRFSDDHSETVII